MWGLGNLGLGFRGFGRFRALGLRVGADPKPWRKSQEDEVTTLGVRDGWSSISSQAHVGASENKGVP